MRRPAADRCACRQAHGRNPGRELRPASTRSQQPDSVRPQAVLFTVDGKGIVTRPEALRSPTTAAAPRSKNKLKGTLVQGREGEPHPFGRADAPYTFVPAPLAQPEDDELTTEAKNRGVTATMGTSASSRARSSFQPS